MEQANDDEYGYPSSQAPMGKHVPRPKVDPEAYGEVDTSNYPQPKESTHKIRGRSDILELLCGTVDQELLVVKSFYFCFYSAFGSLFPLMGVYFKQMGMNASQCGFLIGSRPFVEFLAAPFWGSLADRWKKGKILLLLSLAAWIIFTVPLGFIQPPATSCLEITNNSAILKVPEVLSKPAVSKRSLDAEALNQYAEEESTKQPVTTRTNKPFLPPISAGQSPRNVGFAVNYKPDKHDSWVQPIISSIVYKVQDIQKAFFLLLLLVIIGEFFSAPAITLADSAVITLLGEDADRYGHQRMFGSLGWGLAMFFVGIALDHSTAFPDHPCGPEKKEKNYTICFATFSVLMGAALITATQINFKYEEPTDDPPTNKDEQPTLTYEDKLQAQLAEQLNLPSLADTRANVNGQQLPEEKTKIFAQTTREIPEWVTVLKQFKNLKCASFLFVAWFMGFGIGLIFTFLFWHLQDYDGSPTLFGVASVINHVSEIFAYFFSFRLIRQIGHVKVLCLGLVGNTLRFLYISWLHNPWWVLPFEFMQGITHAAVWAACCSYIAHNTPQQLRSSAQGVLQGIHHGLGRGCGAVIGGIFVNSFGSTATFRGYGLICILVLVAFIFINFYRQDQGFVRDIPVTEDPRQVAEETSHLAPHGVPSNPIPRALSSVRLNELSQQDGYGATYQAGSGGTLDIPGAPANPFLQNTQQYSNYKLSNKKKNKIHVIENRVIHADRVLEEIFGESPPPIEINLATPEHTREEQITGDVLTFGSGALESASDTAAVACAMKPISLGKVGSSQGASTSYAVKSKPNVKTPKRKIAAPRIRGGQNLALLDRVEPESGDDSAVEDVEDFVAVCRRRGAKRRRLLQDRMEDALKVIDEQTRIVDTCRRRLVLLEELNL